MKTGKGETGFAVSGRRIRASQAGGSGAFNISLTQPSQEKAFSAYQLQCAQPTTFPFRLNSAAQNVACTRSEKILPSRVTFGWADRFSSQVQRSIMCIACRATVMLCRKNGARQLRSCTTCTWCGYFARDTHYAIFLCWLSRERERERGGGGGVALK